MSEEVTEVESIDIEPILEEELIIEEPTIEEHIAEMRPKTQDGKVVAFIGDSGCGKTVVSALLKHALSKHFIPNNKGKWEAVPSSGYEFINTVIFEMKKGKFPDQTLEKDYPKLIIDVYHTKGNTTKIKLILRDMSGENYTKLLSTENPNFEEQMDALLDDPEKNAYIIFAKIYVILIDCSQKDDWDADPSNITSTISKLKQFKEKIHHYEEDKKIDNPVAIIFTKADRLKETDQIKSAEELMKEYPGLESSLNINQDGPRGFFKVSVDSKLETSSEVEKRIKDIEERLEKKFLLKKNALKTTMGIAVNKAVIDAEKKSRDADQTEEMINEAKKEAENIVLAKYKPELLQEMPKLENREKHLISKWNVKIPLNYSETEYNRFISWIFENLLK